jgi:GLPGLI family protein
MKYIINSILFTCIFDIFTLSAQTVQATYIGPQDESAKMEYHLLANSKKSLFFTILYDSKTTESEAKDAFGLPQEFNIRFGSKKKYIYKSIHDNELIELDTDFYGDYYKIIDSLHTMTWKITDEVISIKGYNCPKAVTHFRGRDYEAWFSLEIPFSTGPWKAGGLPGLILKLREETGMLDMELQSISFSDEDSEIELPKIKKVKMTTGPELHKLYFDQMEEYFAFKEAQLRKKGSNISITVNRPEIELLEIYK